MSEKTMGIVKRVNQHVGELHDELDAKDKRIIALEHELEGWKLKYEQLKKTYDQLSDQWMAFQMNFRSQVTPRQANRAEAAGELSRLLAQAFLCLAYDRDGLEYLAEFADRLRALRDPTIEVQGGKLVKR